MQGASEQCMHATEIERSPGTPSLIVTTRRRLTPHGISCSCLHAVTQLLHSMQRSASHKNFIRAMVPSWALVLLGVAISCLDHLAQRSLGFLHHRYGVVPVRGGGVDRFSAHHRMGAFGIELEHVLAHPPA